MEPQASSTKKIPFEFHGRAGEYFGIWIVNILLTIITVGIYTAWAKVRTNRYFYGKTVVNNSNFAYLADPITILKGWLIAVVILIIYGVTTTIIPPLEFVFFILLIMVLPLLVVRSMSFRARNSAWQNIRFTFKGKYGEAAMIFIVWGFLLMILSLGLLFPYIQYRMKKFLIENSTYGQSDFEFKANASDFYIVYLIAFGLMTLVGVIVSVVVGIVASQMPGMEAGMQEPQVAQAIMITMIMPILLLAYLFMFAYMKSRIDNITWSGVHIQGNKLESNLRARDLTWIYFTNLLGIMLSFGLLVPWAKVRTMRYRMNKLTLLANGDLDQFVQAEQAKVSALGEEIGEVFDIDIGI